MASKVFLETDRVPRSITAYERYRLPETIAFRAKLDSDGIGCRRRNSCIASATAAGMSEMSRFEYAIVGSLVVHAIVLFGITIRPFTLSKLENSSPALEVGTRKR